MACTHTNINCGCKDSFLTTPAPCPTPEGCPDPQPCSEVFDAQCIVYTGDPIICDQDTVVATNDTVADALNDIVDYLCQNSGGAITVVQAGANTTVTSTTVGSTTTYTVASKEAIVQAGTNITVTSATVGNDTTYTINAVCCPTFAVDINKANIEIYRLDSTLTNGTGPFTYEWTVEQNEFPGLAFTGSTTSANVTLEPVPNNYVDAPATTGLIFQVLVKVKVTDSAGQIATAYYNAVYIAFN
jgi:hypothetical protein